MMYFSIRKPSHYGRDSLVMVYLNSRPRTPTNYFSPTSSMRLHDPGQRGANLGKEDESLLKPQSSEHKADLEAHPADAPFLHASAPRWCARLTKLEMPPSARVPDDDRESNMLHISKKLAYRNGSGLVRVAAGGWRR